MHLAKPEVPTGQGVLVLHSWWGLNGFFRDPCDRLASAGFVALAPDLYDGKTASTIGDARALRAEAGSSRKEPAYRYLIRMIGELESQAPGDVALLGFSMGGHWAYWLSRRPELPVSKTVTFYAARDGDYRLAARPSSLTSPRLMSRCRLPVCASSSAAWPRQVASMRSSPTTAPGTGSSSLTGLSTTPRP